MTNQEAEWVLDLLLGADGGCIRCARVLILDFIGEFPEFTELGRQMFQTEYEDEL
jgi:hypothetical protein